MIIIESIIFFLCSFQLLFLTLYFLISYKRWSYNKRADNCEISNNNEKESKYFPKLRWLVTIPVLRERELLRACLAHSINVQSPLTSLIVCLDGKNHQDVSDCESEVQNFLKNWRIKHEKSIIAYLEFLLKDLSQFQNQRSDLLNQLNKSIPNWKKYEDCLVEEYLLSSDSNQADCIEKIWSCFHPIISLPTSIPFVSPQNRRKAGALNFVTSLCGKKCIWLKFGIVDMIVFGNNVNDLKERYKQVCNKFGTPNFKSLILIPDADIFFCVDVDERIDKAAFHKFQTFTELNQNFDLIQASKVDLPNNHSPFAKAFCAIYSAWFYREAGWIDNENGQPVLRCSYYGSMAAIRLSNKLLEPKELKLTTGESFGKGLFPEGFNIEDYPFFAEKFTLLKTNLLNYSISVGNAPHNSVSLFSLWARWTHDNVRIFVFHTAKTLLFKSKKMQIGIWGYLAIIYHGFSWFAYANLFLLSSVFSFYLILSSDSISLIISLLALLITVMSLFRTLTIAPNAPFFYGILRVFVEYMLFPVSFFFVLSGLSYSFIKLGEPPSVTPRSYNKLYLPIWIKITYVVNLLLLSYSAWIAYNLFSLTGDLSINIFALVVSFNLIRFCIGLLLLFYEGFSNNFLKLLIKLISFYKRLLI